MPRALRFATLCLVIAAAAALSVALRRPDARRVAGELLRMQVQSPDGLYWSLRHLGIREGLPRADFASIERAMRMTAQRPDAGPDLKLAAALMEWGATRASSVRPIDRIHPLLDLYPNNAPLHADWLRLACMGDVRVSRVEVYDISPPPRGQPIPTTVMGSAPGRLAEFDEIAARGERLEPDNGYFSLARATGLFAAHRDKEALAALNRAARAKRWDDYAWHESHALSALMDRALGSQSTALSEALMAGTLLPHFAQIRSAGWVAAAKAMQAELAGRREEGLSIRRDIICAAARMRLSSPSAIGALVAANFASTGAARPGGVPAIGSDGTPDPLGERRVKFDLYLRSIGAPDREKLIGELEASEQERDMIQIALPRSGIGGPRLLELAAAWSRSIALMANAVWLALFGFVSWLLLRALRGGRLASGERIMIAATTGICLLLLMAVVGWQQSQPIRGYILVHEVLNNVYAPAKPADKYALVNMIGLAAVAGPLALITIAGVAQMMRRGGSLDAALRSIALASAPLASVCVIALSSSIKSTAAQEERTRATIFAEQRCEPQFLASLTRKPLPPSPLLRP